MAEPGLDPASWPLVYSSFLNARLAQLISLCYWNNSWTFDLYDEHPPANSNTNICCNYPIFPDIMNVTLLIYCIWFGNFKLVSKLTPVRSYGNLSVKLKKKKKRRSFASEEKGICIRGTRKPSLHTWTFRGGIVLMRHGDSGVGGILGPHCSCINTFFWGPGKEQRSGFPTFSSHSVPFSEYFSYLFQL